MTETNTTLSDSGINLLLTGMIVVFFFLLTLIISIYLLKLFFSDSSNNTAPLIPNPATDGPINKVHERIINEVMEYRRI